MNSGVCTRCVLDTTIPEIRFDENGVCQYCKIHDDLEKEYPLNDDGKRKLDRWVEKIKKDGQGKPYDIIVGVSGGRDSTFGLYMVVKLGLRPLAVHFDNGWNSEIAVTNIKRATEKLNVDLHTFVVDWDEFKDLQISFLKASTSDAEIPTDVAIHGILHRVAAQENIKYILFAHSFRTEGFSPIGWTYMDGRYIREVQKKFGTKKLKTFPNLTISNFFYYRLIKKIQVVPLLSLMEYRHKEAQELLEKELGWKYYGGHHHESYYTHFFQSFYLPRKFNIDKRKLEYSALIRSGQMTREAALTDITQNVYPYDEELVKYTMNKLGLSKEDFESIMKAPRKNFQDYPTYFPLLKILKFPILWATKLNIFPKHLYMKYLG
ncbi:MAG: N-acetyl sugar amidotransferase [Candidatus Omnitrophota bacterium]